MIYIFFYPIFYFSCKLGPFPVVVCQSCLVTSSSVLCLCFLYSSVCFPNVGCWHVPVLWGPAFALVLQKKKEFLQIRVGSQRNLPPNCLSYSLYQSMEIAWVRSEQSVLQQSESIVMHRRPGWATTLFTQEEKILFYYSIFVNTNIL